MKPILSKFSMLLPLLLIFLHTVPINACGGFFCTTFPINQVSERILFVKGEGTVTTHVQIQYTGESHDFVWILPVPSQPKLEVSHNQVFQQLQFATQPSFFLDWQESPCFFPIFRTFDGAMPTAVAEGAVEVVSEERTGPYDTADITSIDANAITEWLTNNDYQLDGLGADLLKPYVDGGFFFLALRLAPDRDLGDLQPIALTYEAEQPGIPIRLTAVATQPDMGVLVWVLGQNRAIPTNTSTSKSTKPVSTGSTAGRTTTTSSQKLPTKPAGRLSPPTMLAKPTSSKIAFIARANTILSSSNPPSTPSPF